MLEERALPLNRLIKQLADAKPGLLFIVLDCCRENPVQFHPSSTTKANTLLRSGFARLTHLPLGTLVVYSTEAGSVANDGIYTESLCKHIKQPSLTALAALAKTRKEVKTITEQWYKEDTQSGHPVSQRRPVQDSVEYQKLTVQQLSYSLSGKHPIPNDAPKNDLEAREQWKEHQARMKKDFKHASRLDDLDAWRAFLKSYQNTKNPFSEEDKAMLSQANKRLVFYKRLAETKKRKYRKKVKELSKLDFILKSKSTTKSGKDEIHCSNGEVYLCYGVSTVPSLVVRNRREVPVAQRVPGLPDYVFNPNLTEQVHYLPTEGNSGEVFISMSMHGSSLRRQQPYLFRVDE